MKTVTKNFLVLGVLALLSAITVPASAQSSVATANAGDGTPQEFAQEILMEMANFMASLERFSVKVRSGYDATQASGQKVEFLSAMNVSVSRPDRLRVDQTREDGSKTMVLFDGAQITSWDAAAEVFAQVAQPGSIDDAYVYFVRDLGMKLPLGSLLLQRLPEELAQNAIAVDYVEYALAPLFEVDAQHIVVRTAIADVQLWIADDIDRPWPLRMVITYPNQPGQPQYWAEFSDWTEKPKIRDSTFQFTPPAGAEQIVFAVQVFPMDETAAATAGGEQP